MLDLFRLQPERGIEVILILAVLALVGGGYYYWRKRKVQLKAKANEIKNKVVDAISKDKP